MMLFRFSLYGFLKNQRYFEPFLLLALLEKGLSFTEVGFLVAFREIILNVFEIPSGAMADVLGRRKAMVVSFTAYIASFVIFGFGEALWHFFGAMFFFGIGDAFRTGTHKAIILDWLRQEGRQDEKTRVYGFTRSWSKIGSAVSALIAAGLVFRGGRYA
ncbi:MAG: MFS transporter, partial [Deltaproteobacteria bacterium]|nr:MFS transporter [Deltaproteobacteria bacterium]